MSRFWKLFLIIWIILPIYSVNGQYRQNIDNLTELGRDKGQLIPLKDLEKNHVAIVVPSLFKYQSFIDQSARYTEIKSFSYSSYRSAIKDINTVVFASTSMDMRNDMLQLIQQAKYEKKQVVVCLFEDQALTWNQNMPQDITLLKNQIFNDRTQKHMAMSLFGGIAITQGNLRTQQIRIQYTGHERSDLNLSKMASKIDAIASEAIQAKATPGLVVMAIKGGQVIFEKAYGHHTYEKEQVTKTSDIFDLASISKIVATTPVVMHLYERNVIHLDSTIGNYLEEAGGTNKAETTLRSVMLHEAGFTPFIPFYRNLKEGDVQTTPDEQHAVKMADHLYLLTDYYRDVMWPEMLNSRVQSVGKYIYSDISMYVMKEVAEKRTAKKIDAYVQDLLYKPLGMKTAGFNPRNRFAKNTIVPTEYDKAFRGVLLEGYVHDQGAAMAGGVAGHAGLFGSANDLAIFGQLMLNRGTYGGIRYYKAETVDLFTSRQSQKSRRGLGFDRYDPDDSKAYPSKLANASVFGHTGYTGTCIWIDPRHQLVYIFLSNRVHPQVNNKLFDLNIRSRIQDAIYETVNEAK